MSVVCLSLPSSGWLDGSERYADFHVGQAVWLQDDGVRVGRLIGSLAIYCFKAKHRRVVGFMAKYCSMLADSYTTNLLILGKLRWA